MAERPGPAPVHFPKNEPGVADLVTRLLAAEPTLIVLEATGGLEGAAVAALVAAGLPVAVVKPRQVRDFAKAVGHLAKTDALDAHLLAHVADVIRPVPKPLPEPERQALAALLTRRHQILAMLVAEQQRLGSAALALRPRIEAPIAWLRPERDDLGPRRVPPDSAVPGVA